MQDVKSAKTVKQIARTSVDWKKAQKKAAKTAKWAVTMTKVRIRRVLARTRWQLVTFCGVSGGESVGVVDLLAVRKDHRKPRIGVKRGDDLQLILIQVKGGSAAMPTADDASRLRKVAKRHHAREVLLGSWKRGTQVRFFKLRPKSTDRQRRDWKEVSEIENVFR
jgi:hypothetical protein